MMHHLQGFIESFIDKRYRKAWLYDLARAKPGDNLVRGMDALYRKLDERYCTLLPKGNQQKEVAFMEQAIAKYKLATCYVLSAYEPFNQQLMPIDAVLAKIVGSTSTTIISFVPGKVAYFEGHSPGSRYLCIKEAE